MANAIDIVVVVFAANNETKSVAIAAFFTVAKIRLNIDLIDIVVDVVVAMVDIIFHVIFHIVFHIIFHVFVTNVNVNENVRFSC